MLKVKNWSFYIQASDSGSSALSSAVPALVQVTVQDVNDMPPAFNKKEYNAHLLLPTLKGSLSLKCSAGILFVVVQGSSLEK